MRRVAKEGGDCRECPRGGPVQVGSAPCQVAARYGGITTGGLPRLFFDFVFLAAFCRCP